MELGSCHHLVAYNFGLAPRFLESLCTPALRSYGLFQRCAPTRWKAATLSVTERKSVVSSGDVNVLSATTKKTGLQTKNPPDICEFIQSFARSFIHSFIRLTNFMAIHELAVKEEDKFPTIATQPEMRTMMATDILFFGKYQGV
jgi:hypothetical protein